MEFMALRNKQSWLYYYFRVWNVLPRSCSVRFFPEYSLSWNTFGFGRPQQLGNIPNIQIQSKKGIFFKKGYLMVDSIIQKARKIKADFQGFFLFGEKSPSPIQ